MNDLGNKEIFAENLAYYMARQKMERDDICKTLGFKYTTVSDWLNAKKYPRIDKIEIMADYFGITKADLIEKKEKPTTVADGGQATRDAKLLEAIKQLSPDARRIIEAAVYSAGPEGSKQD